MDEFPDLFGKSGFKQPCIDVFMDAIQGLICLVFVHEASRVVSYNF